MILRGLAAGRGIGCHLKRWRRHRCPGFAGLIRIGPVSGGRERSSLIFGPVRIALGGEIRDVVAPKKRASRWR